MKIVSKLRGLFWVLKNKKISSIVILTICLALSACGGGGGGGEDPGPVIIGTGATLRGIAADGAALANREVVIKAKQGKQVTTQTLADGTFPAIELINEESDSSQLKALIGPYLARVDREDSSYYYSIAYRGSEVTGTALPVYLNLHPFTDLILRNWFAIEGTDIDAAFADDSEILLPEAEQITAITEEIKNIIVEALEANNTPIDFDLFVSEFSANGFEFDAFLDNSNVSIFNQKINVEIKDAITKIQTKIIKDVDLDTDFTSEDVEPPTDPFNPRALVAEVTDTEAEVVVFWGPSEDNRGVAGYRIYRDGTFISKTAFPVFVDAGLQVGQIYNYEVEAFDGSDNRSNRIVATVTVDAPDTTPPPASYNLDVVEIENKIELSWSQDNIQDVAGFIILRNDNNEYAVVTGTTFTDFNVVSGVEYCYQLITFDAADNRSAAVPDLALCEVMDGTDDPLPAAPIAAAGSDLNRFLGQTATLDGSASSDANGDPLTYQWAITSQPSGSNASLDNDQAAQPTLSVDTAGNYTLELIVSDGSNSSDPDSILVTIADGDQDSDGLLSSIELIIGLNPNESDTNGNGTNDGLEDFDGDGLPNINEGPLGYAIDDSDSDDNGINDGNEDLDGDGFTNAAEISAGSNPNNDGSTPGSNSIPTSNAGTDQTITLGQTATLDGSGSSDPDGDSLTYQWSITGQPSGATANLDNNQIAQPTLSADTAGDYTIELVVNDGIDNSNPNSVIISVNTAPTSIAGPGQTITLGETATLDGTASSDPDGDSLTYQWSITSQPSGATASLDNNQIAQPTLSADTVGDYTIELVVNDGLINSSPDNVTISVSELNEAPVINSFTVSTAPLSANVPATFGWDVNDVNGDTLTCRLDVDNDGIDDYTINDCANTTTQAHAFSVVGDYTARLTLDDGVTTPVSATVTVTVVNDSPVINSFTNSPAPAFLDAPTTFSWDINDVNGDTLTCFLDVDNDGLDDYTINDCGNTASQGHTYTAAGDYTAQLIVEDGAATPVVATINFSVISPLSTDVSVTTPVVAGERLIYTITVGNTTALPINDVEVSTVVPTELSFNRTRDAQPDPSGCSGNCFPTNEPLWILGTIGAGESRTITVNALVDVATLDGSTISLPVSISATNIGDIQIDKVVQVFNNPSAELALGASTDPVVPGQTFTYELDVGNTSAGSLTATELRAFLPVGVTVTSISDGGTEVSSGEVVWSEGSLGVGSSLRREITVSADAGLVAGQVLQARAQLTHAGGQVIDNTAEQAITVVASSLPLEVDISTSANPVVQDERVIYTLTVSNSSVLPVDDVSVLLRLPAELGFNRVRDAEPDPTGCSGTCIATQEALWALGTLAAGESRTITVNALVDFVLSGTLITVPVRITATDLGDDIDVQKTIAVFNSPSADLGLAASTDPVVPDQIFSYQLDVGNTSAGPLTATELRAFLPAGVTVTSISDGGVEVSPGEVVWSEGSLDVGSSLRREITVTADTDLVAGQVLQTTAQLTHDGGLAIDNTVEHAVNVVASNLPLVVDISTSVNPVVQDERVLYNLTVSNASVLPVDDVNVSLRLPAELSFNRIRDAEPDPAVCSGSCLPTDEPLWILGTLAAGESRTITVNALIDTVLSGTLITLPVRITATDLGDDIDVQKTIAVFNSPSANLALSASTDAVVADQIFSYELDVSNTSAGALAATELRAFLPAGVTVTSISNGGTEVSPGEVVWSEGSLGVGSSRHREITVTADTDLIAGQVLKARVQLTHDGGQAIDNTAEQAVSVVAASLPLAVDISTSANPVVQDERVLYTLTVSNTSVLPVDNVNVLLRLPTELSFSRLADAEPVLTGCSGTCIATQEALWALGTLAAGESRTITVNALIDTVLSGTLITVPVRITSTDLLDDIDVQKTIAVFNSPSADLALSTSTDALITSESFSYVLDVGNTSGGSLSTTELRAFLPAGVTVTSISDGGSEPSTGEVAWSPITLASGASARRVITVQADGALVGDILALDAELSFDGGLEIDNQSEFAVTVAETGGIASLLSVDIAATPGTVAPGGALDYTITVTNNFGLPVDGVTVLLRVPAEISFSRITDAEPDATGCSGNCLATQEALWSLGTIAAGASQVITINATVATGIDDANLILAPFRVEATGMEDTINLQHISVIEN